jgi:PAS domain S-box-containing protein
MQKSLDFGPESQRVLFHNNPERMEVNVGKKIYLIVFHPLPEQECVNISGFDISVQKELEEKLQDSEDKYRNIVEETNEGIIIIADEAIVTYANKKAAEMLGYSLEDGIGRPIWDFLSEESKAIVKTEINRVWQITRESYELELIRKDYTSLWTLINAKPLFSKRGKFTGIICMLTDITERKKAEEALANYEANRKKEIHHRIKNNLQVISSLLDLQADQFKGRKDIKDSEVLEAFRESQDRVISMALIHEELHKGEGGETDTLDFPEYIEELADNLFLTYRLGNAEIRLDTDLEENIFLGMDTSVPLGIIINELISNSLKYAFVDRDKGEIQIKLHRERNRECKSEDYNTSYALSVSDNGVGISKNVDIKNPDSLGLQLVTSLVEQLDGELELKRDIGTEFIIRFTIEENNNPASVLVHRFLINSFLDCDSTRHFIHFFHFISPRK